MVAAKAGANTRERHGAAFVTGAMLGGVAGAVWGLLNATETGADARAALGRATEDAVERLLHSAADAEIAAREWLSRDHGHDPAASARPAWPATIDADEDAAETVVLGGEALVGQDLGDLPGVDVVIDGPRPLATPSQPEPEPRLPDQPA